MMDPKEYAEITRMLGRIETDVQLLRIEQKDVKQYARDISTRVRALEISQGRAVGWASGAGAVVGTIVSLIVAFFTRGAG